MPYELRRLLGGVALLLAASHAAAESTSPVTRMPTSGLDQPATSAALADGPEAAVVNPAGLGFQRGLTLRYLHETAPGPNDDLVAASGDGLYLGDRFFGLIGFGLSMEWVRPKGSEDLSFANYRRTTWGLSLGGESLSIGAAAHVFSRGIVDDRVSWDLGLMARPRRYLSVGLLVRDVDGPSAAGEKIPRRYVASVAARPLGDWLSLAVDGEVLGGENPAIDNGFAHLALGYTARARILEGVTLLASLSHRIDGDGPLIIQGGLALDFPHLGLFGTPLVRTRHGSTGFLVGGELRFSDHVPGVDLAPGREVALVDVGAALSSPGGLRLLPGEPSDPVLDFVLGLERLADDDRVGGLILEFRSVEVGMGQAFELRRAIQEFRLSGKPVVAMLYGADDATYYLASAAEKIYSTPDAALFINGFSSSAIFFGETLSAFGVKIDVAKVGAYKNAPDALTRSEISPEQEEVMRSILDDIFPRYLEDVATARGIDPLAFEASLDRGVLTAMQAADEGLLDGLLFPDELGEEIARLMGTPARITAAPLGQAAWTSWGPPPEIAIIPIEGTIVAGRSSGGMGFLQTTGARSVVEQLGLASVDPKVRAIVLRIDSGGGDAGGSQLIWRAVRRAAEVKPVIASMSGSAASGGYLAAVGADRIFAAPDTLTGSIGVFWLKPSLEGVFELLGIGTHQEKRGAQADINSLERSWSAEEQASVQAWVDSFYRQFVDATAHARGLEPEEVDRLARGRVWTGAQAQERGLVDEIGGLGDALQAARHAAGLSSGQLVRHRVFSEQRGILRFSAGGSMAVEGNFGPELPPLLQKMIQEKIPTHLLVENPSGLWAVAPFTWKLR